MSASKNYNSYSSKLFEKSIVHQGIKLWNALPVELRDMLIYH